MRARIHGEQGRQSMTDNPTLSPKPPTPADLFFEEWRSLICPTCEHPLDLQLRDPWTWWCAMCRKWFDGDLKKL
jgi:hypothetical protein